jgi:chromosome segregation protein
MKLRRIVLSGFKTFAHRSEIRFEPGITGVVGPNGSGKSNLVDAIRWALGETNARELRGSRLDEVIFAGGQGRPRMGVAEVELVLDNEDGGLPADDAEVSVSRRVVRGGDVEYRINSERARLRDVERLLGGTGLTQHGYAVVAQNDIEAIIEATPRQRRSLVEQAAGVRPLRVACDDALRRLEGVGITVQRLVDRLGESEPRLSLLESEAEAALEQRGLATRLAELRGSLTREEWRSARAQLKQARRRVDAAARRLEAARLADAGYAERLDAQRESLEQARAAQRLASQQLEEARLAAERAGGETRRFADRIVTAVLRRSDARLDLRRALLDEEEAGGALVDLAGSDAEVRRRLQGLEASVSDLTSVNARVSIDAVEARRALAAADADVARATEGLSTAQGGAREAAARAALLEEAVRSLSAELLASRQRVAELQSAAHAAQAVLGEAEARAARAEQTAAARATDLETARAALRQAEARLLADRERTAQAIARAASLQGQVEGALGGSGAVSAHASELGAARLIDSLRVRDPADSAALEAALEPHLGAWIVSDLDRALGLLQAADLREEVLVSGDAAEAVDAPMGEVRPAISAVAVAPGAGQAAAHCLARTWLVPDVTAARRVVAGGSGRAILPDGTVITAAGARAGGGHGATLRLVEQAREAEAAARAAAEAEATAEAGVRRLSAAVTAADTAAATAAARLTTSRREVAAAAAPAGAAQAGLAMEERRLPSLEAEVTRRTEAAAAALEAASGAGAESARLGQSAESSRVARERASREAADRAGREASVVAQLAAAQRELADTRRARDEVDRLRSDGAKRRGEAALRVAQAEARVAAAETDVLMALARSGDASTLALSAADGVARAEGRLSHATGPLSHLEAGIAAAESERSEVRVAVARAEDEVNAASSEAGALELRAAELADSVREEIDEEAAELDAAGAERAEREITRLERRVVAMGPVNALAPEQHEVLAERVTRQRADRDDLAVASGEIRNLARRLGTEAGRRFDAVFGAVSVHFAELFGELFPGGRAALHLEDADAPPAEDGRTVPDGDRLPGIQILAQPAGKRLQPLSHLSGGERALTAMAVIFALEHVNPSPFYVFDEVDAALDDANVARFTRLLSRLAQRQQFLVVTHNHMTMAVADALYGVTIDREGVTSVLSVRLPAHREANAVAVGVAQRPLRSAVS